MEVLEVGVIVLAAGAAVTYAVALAEMAGLATTPARKVGTAVLSSAILVALYAVSAGAVSVANGFALAAATITIAAAAVGIHEINDRAPAPPSTN